MRIFAGAGEPSGDRMLAEILAGLRRHFPKMEVRGFGGRLSALQGLQSSVGIERLAVNGLSDTIQRFFPLTFAFFKLRREMKKFHPDLVLLVDYPGMNERLGSSALKYGFKMIYIAPPQLWVYRNPKIRLQSLHKRIPSASLQVLFPFEAGIYSAWAPRVFQGHFFAPPSTLPPTGDRLLICPGSRPKVMNRNLPVWLQHVTKSQPNLAMDILIPENLAGDARRWIEPYSGIRLVHDSKIAFEQAVAAIVFPGTMALEIFLRRIPMRIWAIVDAPTLWAGQRRLAKPWVALPNLLMDRPAFPEWVGTGSQFTQNPPDFPPLSNWPGISQGDVDAVWSIMGPSNGAEVGVKACLELLQELPVLEPLPTKR